MLSQVLTEYQGTRLMVGIDVERMVAIANARDDMRVISEGEAVIISLLRPDHSEDCVIFEAMQNSGTWWNVICDSRFIPKS